MLHRVRRRAARHARRTPAARPPARRRGLALRTAGAHARDPRSRGPIGVFDSGLGGLTAGARAVPRAAARVAWSTSATPRALPVRQQVARDGDALQPRDRVASWCARTSSACWSRATPPRRYALDALRARFDVPVIGVIEPAARAAVRGEPARPDRRDRHARHGRQRRLRRRDRARWRPRRHRDLARLPAVRAAGRGGLARPPGDARRWPRSTSPSCAARAARQPDPRLHALPAARAAARTSVMGPAVTLIDSGAEAARATAGLLRRARPARRGRRAPQHHFFLSDEPRASFARVAAGVPRPRAAAGQRGGPDRPAVVRARRHASSAAGPPPRDRAERP